MVRQEGGQGPAWENLIKTGRTPMPHQGTESMASGPPQSEVLAASKHMANKDWAWTRCGRCQICLQVLSQGRLKGLEGPQISQLRLLS